MANEKRLIDANALIAYFDNQYNAAMDDPDPVSGYVMAALRCCIDYFKAIPTVDAVVLPYTPRPMLKDRNPYNTDVYCPECGMNLSGYYGDEPLPIVTCFNCGEILDPYKATTGTDGERKYNEID